MRYIHSFLMFMLILVLPLSGPLSAQNTPVASLRVEGDLKNPLNLNLSELQQMDPVEVEARDSEDAVHRYRGVPLHRILARAGVAQGTDIRGKELIRYVRVTAADGYEVLFSLAELDPVFNPNPALLDFEMDGAPLPAGMGPLRMVVPQEKRHARWIREVRLVKVGTPE